MSAQSIYDACRLSGGEFRAAIKEAIIEAHEAPHGYTVAVLLNTDTEKFSLSDYLSSCTTVGRGEEVDTVHVASWSIEHTDYADYKDHGLTEDEAVADYAEDIADFQATKALETLSQFAGDEQNGY